MQQELKEAFRLYDKEGLYFEDLMKCLRGTASLFLSSTLFSRVVSLICTNFYVHGRFF